MKKLLTLLVATAAIASQAASINWIVTQVKTSSDSSVAASSYLGLFFIVDETSDPAVTVDTVSSLLDDGKAADAAALATYSKATNASGGISSSGLGTYAAGTTVTAFTVVLDAANAADAKNYIITGTMQKTAPTTGAMAFSFGSQANATYKNIGETEPDNPDEPIPEPATGALALAGVALLFRRRR